MLSAFVQTFKTRHGQLELAGVKTHGVEILFLPNDEDFRHIKCRGTREESTDVFQFLNIIQNQITLRGIHVPENYSSTCDLQLWEKTDFDWHGAIASRVHDHDIKISWTLVLIIIRL